MFSSRSSSGTTRVDSVTRWDIGYMLIDVDNRDEAIGIAARVPLAHKATVEVPAREGRAADVERTEG